MPIIRKIISVGDAKGITLPKSWLEWIERETGIPPKEVIVEIDRFLKIEPIIPKEKEKGATR